jgi:hypothetical protein
MSALVDLFHGIPSPASSLILVGGTMIVSGFLTIGLARFSGRSWLGFLIAAPLPALMIVSWYFYLESQQPVGPYYAIIGIVHAASSLMGGMLGASIACFIIALRDNGVAGGE